MDEDSSDSASLLTEDNNENAPTESGMYVQLYIYSNMIIHKYVCMYVSDEIKTTVLSHMVK